MYQTNYPAVGMNLICIKLLIFIFQLCIVPTCTVCTMDLSASTQLLGVRYDSLDNLIHNIQIYAFTQGYAVCRLCIKKSAFTGLLETCYLCCDWGWKKRTPTGQKQKYDRTSTNDCPFSIVAKTTKGSWFILEIWNPNCNHLPTIAASYLLLWKLHFTPTITSEIEQTTRVNFKPAAIVDFLWLAQGSDFDNNQPTYKIKDIYNVRADLQQKNPGILSPIQAFMQKLSTSAW